LRPTSLNAKLYLAHAKLKTVTDWPIQAQIKEFIAVRHAPESQKVFVTHDIVVEAFTLLSL
jgi:hypothetical protein